LELAGAALIARRVGGKLVSPPRLSEMAAAVTAAARHRLGSE
jgi:hypothetical protein